MIGPLIRDLGGYIAQDAVTHRLFVIVVLGAGRQVDLAFNVEEELLPELRLLREDPMKSMQAKIPYSDAVGHFEASIAL